MQDALVENEEKPGAIPNRPMKITELVELKILAREAKERLEWLAAGIKTFNLEEKLPKPIETINEILDESGIVCDNIMGFCQKELKKAELPKKRKGGKIS